MKIIPYSVFPRIDTDHSISPSSPATYLTGDTSEINLNNFPAGFYSKGEAEIKAFDLIKYPKHTPENYKACLLGGAVGDALGNPVEFDTLNTIKRIYGNNGITELVLNNGKAEITDDTQMTIFTADGLIKSSLSDSDFSDYPDMSKVYSSYLDWYDTQNGAYMPKGNGWISNIRELYARRAPGLTCTGSLARKVPGSIKKPVNNSKGCGGVMRAAPAGLKFYNNPEKAFEVGAQCAALTHGSPDAYLPAGVLACIIANLVQGKDIETSVDNSLDVLRSYDDHENVLELINRAKSYANSTMDSEDAIRKLGEGWNGDEAIAIAVYCVLKSPDNFKDAVIMSVNHDGDSDSTGSITGNIMGTALGVEKIPKEWTNSIELADELKQIAEDLYLKPSEIKDAAKRYPNLSD